MISTNNPTPSFHVRRFPRRAVEYWVHNENKTGDTAFLQKDEHTSPKETGFSDPTYFLSSQGCTQRKDLALQVQEGTAKYGPGAHTFKKADGPARAKPRQQSLNQARDVL